MDFQRLPNIESAKFYMDTAIGRAAKIKDGGNNTKARMKIQTVHDFLDQALDKIVNRFPHLDTMVPFYKELFESVFDYDRTKKSLGALIWARQQKSRLFRTFQRELRDIEDPTRYPGIIRRYYGRTLSVMKQIDSDLKYLRETLKGLRDFPTIKNVPTIAIAGFPNVGKTTLLGELTGSHAEVANYAFTTKGINVSYLDGVQILDTPGTLNRVDKMNKVEYFAHLSLKHVADVIVYIFDPTETYPLEEQILLYQKVLDHSKPVYVYVSKLDIAKMPKELEKYDIVDMEGLKKIAFDMVKDFVPVKRVKKKKR